MTIKLRYIEMQKILSTTFVKTDDSLLIKISKEIQK